MTIIYKIDWWNQMYQVIYISYRFQNLFLFVGEQWVTKEVKRFWKVVSKIDLGKFPFPVICSYQ